jgi:Protein of unknown function (DUF2911)
VSTAVGARWRSLVLPLLAGVACRAPANAQRTPRSQLGTVSQTIAGTTIEITYRRPVAHGRALFGSLVPWGRVWTPSADSVARITLSRAVEVNGARLAAGAYGVWAIPDSASWTVIFSSVPRAFHLAYPEGRDALRVHAMPERGEHMETLAFYFPVADADSAVLRLHWGTTVVPLTLRAVDASAP